MVKRKTMRKKETNIYRKTEKERRETGIGCMKMNFSKMY